MLAKVLRLCICCVSLTYCATALALPPLGLTQIDSGFRSLEIIDGTAYTSGQSAVLTVSPHGDLSTVSIFHPTFGQAAFVTRIVKALDNQLYMAATFPRNSNFEFDAALFRLTDPSSPLVTWNSAWIGGIDRNLRAFGTVENATVFYPDGSSATLPFPTGSDHTNNSTWVTSATPSGYILGEGGIPGTIGSSPFLWTPEGNFYRFVFGIGSGSSIRDRNDGTGLNIGNGLIEAALLGEHYFYVVDSNGAYFYDPSTIVSQSDFFVIQQYIYFSQGWVPHAFYPGIFPGFPDRAVPLMDIFPELAAIDIDTIHDLASVDGYLYMTLSGADGTFLFGARDPSVVPEPGAGVMMLLGAIVVWRRRPLAKRR